MDSLQFSQNTLCTQNRWIKAKTSRQLDTGVDLNGAGTGVRRIFARPLPVCSQENFVRRARRWRRRTVAVQYVDEIFIPDTPVAGTAAYRTAARVFQENNSVAEHLSGADKRQ